MNIPEKIYCRAFQAVLHTALPVLPYRKPKLLDSMTPPTRLRILPRYHSTEALKYCYQSAGS